MKSNDMKENVLWGKILLRNQCVSCRLKDLNWPRHPLLLLWWMGLRVPCQGILINGTLRWHGFPLSDCLCCEKKRERERKKKKKNEAPDKLTSGRNQITDMFSIQTPTNPSSQSVSVSRNISHVCHFSFTKKPSVRLKASRRSGSEPLSDLLARGMHFLKISQCGRWGRSQSVEADAFGRQNTHTHIHV